MQFSLDVFHEGLNDIRNSPHDCGTIQMLVRRPNIDMREIISQAQLDTAHGLIGDNWAQKPSSSMPNGEANPEKQITLMNSRCIAIIAGSKNRWSLAGDQIYVDINMSYANLPPGTKLAIGTAIIQVSEPPHRGCKKFAERFGQDAMRFVNSEVGRELNLRGINCKVIQNGIINTGDTVCKVKD